MNKCCCETIYENLSTQALIANIRANLEKWSIKDLKALNIFIDTVRIKEQNKNE